MASQVKFIGKLLASSAISVLTLQSGPAFAQDDTGYVDEIIVTATKRAQSTQDIGIAITAVSGDSLREQGIDSGQDLAKIIPNVAIKNIGGGGLPVVIVRGIGLQNFRVNDSPTTSFYVDEVYQTSIASAEFSMYDLDRVEVLKGPQGGLYGRNTIGGAIQVISKRPEFDEGISGFLTAGLSTYLEQEIETGINIPISDKVAARVSGRYQKSGDRYTQSIPGGFDQGGVDRSGARIQLRFEPSDSIDFNLKLHAGKDDSATPLLRPVGLYQNIGGSGFAAAPNVSAGLLLSLLGAGGGLCDSILAGNGSDPNTCATLTGVTPSGYGLVGNYDSATAIDVPGLDTDWHGISGVGNFDFGDFTLTSVTAYDKIDYSRVINADSTPVEFQVIDYNSDIESWQQEFRLGYNGSDQYNWIIGVNYAEDELIEDTFLRGAEGVLPLFFGGAIASPQNYTQKTNAFAIFGHGEYGLTDDLKVIGELRYTDAKKTFVGGQIFNFADGSQAPFFNVDDEISFDALSGKLGLEYQVDPDVLLYGSVSRGFKTGGFFGGFATNPAQLTPFNEETVWAYEAGFKSDLADGRARVNGSVFYYDRADVQQSATNPGGIPPIARLDNIGDVTAYGAELDVTYVPTDNLTLNGAIGYTDSEVTDSDFLISPVLPLQAAVPIEGTNTPSYSKFSANALVRYEHPLNDMWVGSVQAEYSYRSSQDLSLITNETLEAPIFREGGYSLVNLRIGIGDVNNRWKLTAFVENLFDQEYRVEARGDGLFGVRELYGAPRVGGLSLTANFD